MSKPLESEVIRKFRERVNRRTPTENLKIIYRIAGGMPSERVEEEFNLSCSGKTKIVFRDALRSIPPQEAFGKLDQAETHDLLRRIASGLDSLVPSSEAHFLPDSAVGSITIAVNKEEETLYFLADEEEQLAQDKPISAQMTEAIQCIRKISQRLLKRRKEEGNE